VSAIGLQGRDKSEIGANARVRTLANASNYRHTGSLSAAAAAYPFIQPASQLSRRIQRVQKTLAALSLSQPNASKRT